MEEKVTGEEAKEGISTETETAWNGDLMGIKWAEMKVCTNKAAPPQACLL